MTIQTTHIAVLAALVALVSCARQYGHVEPAPRDDTSGGVSLVEERSDGCDAGCIDAHAADLDVPGHHDGPDAGVAPPPAEPDDTGRTVAQCDEDGVEAAYDVLPPADAAVRGMVMSGFFCGSGKASFQPVDARFTAYTDGGAQLVGTFVVADDGCVKGVEHGGEVWRGRIVLGAPRDGKRATRPTVEGAGWRPWVVSDGVSHIRNSDDTALALLTNRPSDGLHGFQLGVGANLVDPELGASAEVYFDHTDARAGSRVGTGKLNVGLVERCRG